MGGESVLGPVPGFIALATILLVALFYYIQKPRYHPALGEKIPKGDDRFNLYKEQGYPVHIATSRPVGAPMGEDEEMPPTRTLFLYFQAKGYPPTNDVRDEYEYIALPPTARDWIIEFVLWLLIPILAVLITAGARVMKVAVIVLFLYIVFGLAFILVHLPFSFLFGTTVGAIFGVLASGVALILIATKYRNPRLIQWVF